MKILIDMKLKTNLRDLIKKRHMSIKALGVETSISVQTLHNWLSGAEPKKLDQLKRVADYFDVTIDELLFGKVKLTESSVKESKRTLADYDEEINAGIFEVVLRRKK